MNSMAERVCFLVYRDWEEVLSEFDDKTFRELNTAVFRYGFDKENIELSPMARIAMKLIKPVLDRDWQKYSERSETNRNNGAKGGRPKKPNGIIDNPENPVGYEKPSGLLENQTVSEKTEKTHINEILNIKNKKQEIDNIDYSSVCTDTTEQDIKEIVAFYNQTASGCNLIKCLRLSDKRRKQIKARLRESGKEKIFEAITIASQSAFLNGLKNDFRADLEFITNANKFLLILEGRYTDKNGTNIGSNTGRAVDEGSKAIQSIIIEDEF